MIFLKVLNGNMNRDLEVYYLIKHYEEYKKEYIKDDFMTSYVKCTTYS